jgi:hypothetical protein
MTQPGGSYIHVGDRVEVHPESASLRHLEGKQGVVELIHEDDGKILGGALHVRMDLDDRTLGIGRDNVTRLEA